MGQNANTVYIAVGTPGHADYVRETLKSMADELKKAQIGIVCLEESEERLLEVVSQAFPIRVPKAAELVVERYEMPDNKRNDVWRKSHKRRFK